ncbi:hypothetical protein SAMN05428985_11031 [Nocardioides sp. YR527]|uniref:hypothetical protein n=1 Tax=Nocardioides sp. YR527 TaxID=1881028 RepID=UPI000881C3C0|nr:hypothetical protein [Nocardioides sp. YR527]SDL14331.1 hypothetical protein SAMN05428985_11031 [Nocardioides sp. YR527]
MADYRREYDLSPDAVAVLDLPEFLWLLRGLSPSARFMKAWRDAPRNVYTDADIAAVHDN